MKSLLLLLSLPLAARADMTALKTAAALSPESQSSVFDGSRGSSPAPLVSFGAPAVRSTGLSATAPKRVARSEVAAPGEPEGTLRKDERGAFAFELLFGLAAIALGVVVLASAPPVGGMLLGAGLQALGTLSLAKAFNRLDD